MPPVIPGPDTTLCPGESILLDAGNLHSNYAWQNGAGGNTFPVNNPGHYSVTAFLGNCPATDSISVLYFPLLSLFLGQDTGFCPGSNLTLNAGGVWNTVSWSNGSSSNSITVNLPGTYSVAVCDSGNCPYGDTINIIQYPEPIVNLGPDSSLCENETILIHAGNPGSVYQWQNSFPQETFFVTNPGTYWVEVTNVFGCRSRDTIEIDYNFLPPDLGPDLDICNGDDSTRYLFRDCRNRTVPRR